MMPITEDLQTGIEYYYDRTDGWDWIDGRHRWWEIFVEFSGFNGCGGVWLIERWRWNGSSETIREQVKTLSYDESQKVIEKVREHLKLQKSNAL